MGKVIEVMDENFEEEVLHSDIPTEVDFWAPWCGPCHMVSPIYDKLSKEYENFKFCKMNVDENKVTAMKYQIMSIPMQMFFANGEKVDEILGAVPEQTIRSKVEDVLKRYPTDEFGRIRVLLTSWTENNRKHRDNFVKLAEKAERLKNDPIYHRIIKAEQEMERSNDMLSQILSDLERRG